jgi:hypothetical protein
MSTDPPTRRPGASEDEPGEGFAEGEARPDEFPQDEQVGRFSDGQEDLPDVDPEHQHHGRFSEGQEDLGEEDPEKHVEGRFSTGEDAEPPGSVP